MKKEYIKPLVHVLQVQHQHIICASGGNAVYGNESASGANQLSRQRGGWDDDE